MPKCAPAAVAAAMLLTVGAARAQQPANPANMVPDRMPFDVPYGAPITLDRAQAVIEAVMAECRKHGWKMNVAVVDSGANLVAFARMDGAQIASIEIAQHKARAAAMFRRETKVFELAVNGGGAPGALSVDGVIAARGGVPLIEDGKLIGAVGASGGAGSQDEVCVKAGVATVR